MNNVLKAKRYLAESSARIIDAKNVLRMGSPPSTLELCNEAIELALKACITLFGIPLGKNPRSVVMDNRKRFPSWFINRLEDILLKESPEEVLRCIRKAEELNNLVWELIKKVNEN